REPERLRTRDATRTGTRRARARWHHVRPSTGEGQHGMFDLISGQLPWWVAGRGVGLCVVALYGLINARLGVSGAWLATIPPLEGPRPAPRRRPFPPPPPRG